MPYQPFWKIAKMALFYPCMKFEFFWGQMILFKVVKNNLFIKCLWLCPSAYLSGNKWINRIISKSACAISKILFILGSYKFLAYLECIRSYAWSLGYSEPDLSSVIQDWKFVKVCGEQLISVLKFQNGTWNVF